MMPIIIFIPKMSIQCLMLLPPTELEVCGMHHMVICYNNGTCDEDNNTCSCPYPYTGYECNNIICKLLCANDHYSLSVKTCINGQFNIMCMVIPYHMYNAHLRTQVCTSACITHTYIHYTWLGMLYALVRGH